MEDISPWLVCPSRGSGKIRAFCFPHAGAGISVFRGWAQRLQDVAEVSYVQLPGREDRFREPPFTSLADLVGALVEVFAPVIDRPYVLYGHSVGGLIAFELARALRRMACPEPSYLFVSATSSPQTTWPHRPIHQLPEEEFLDEIQQRYRRVPRQLLEDPEMRRVMVPVLRSDVALIETYVYEPDAKLACPISAYGGLADLTVSRASLEGWRHQTCDMFELELLNAGHFFIGAGQMQIPDAIGRRLASSGFAPPCRNAVPTPATTP